MEQKAEKYQVMIRVLIRQRIGTYFDSVIYSTDGYKGEVRMALNHVDDGAIAFVNSMKGTCRFAPNKEVSIIRTRCDKFIIGA